MMLVVIESPYAGDVVLNKEYCRMCMCDSLARGEAPIASHLLYTQSGVLDDTIETERQQGIDAGLAWGAKADIVAVYTDLGFSPGMNQGIKAAKSNGITIVHRKIL